MTVQETANSIRTEIGKVIVGQRQVVDELLISFFVGGHVLLEGVPGVGKTLLVNCLAHCVNADFKRIQFTPDLMPSDIVGTNVFNLKDSQFVLNKGPLFTDVLLADEINRTPPKTQAALLEAMQEGQATIDGVSYPLSPIFLVCATQNPVEYEGTYPLPEAQLDRFLMKVRIDYPSQAEEREIAARYQITPGAKTDPLLRVAKILTIEQVLEIKKLVNNVRVEDKILDYVVQIVTGTRQLREAALGASPRATISMLHCAKAAAAMDGQDYITPDHVKSVALPVLRHRIIVTPEAEVEGFRTDNIIERLLGSIDVPR